MSEKTLKTLITQFENKTLSKDKWTHEAHLIVAIWYLKNHTKEAATCLLRSGIITYNMAVGTKNTPTSGYHETITLFWIWLIGVFIQSNKDLTINELINSFLASKYSNKSIFFDYYSRELLFSVKARAIWVEPDLAELVLVVKN